MVFFAFRRFRAGVSNLFSSSYDNQPAGGGQTYAGYPPTIDTGSFSQPPFTATQSPQSKIEQPTY